MNRRNFLLLASTTPLLYLVRAEAEPVFTDLRAGDTVVQWNFDYCRKLLAPAKVIEGPPTSSYTISGQRYAHRTYALASTDKDALETCTRNTLRWIGTGVLGAGMVPTKAEGAPIANAPETSDLRRGKNKLVVFRELPTFTKPANSDTWTAWMRLVAIK